MPTERFDVNLTLKAQRTGEKVFAETEAGLKIIKDAVRRFSEAEANGYVASRAYKEAIKDLRTDSLEAGLAFEAEAQVVRDATRAIDRFREAEAAGIPVDEAMIATVVENTAATEAEAAATDTASSANEFAIPTWLAVAAAIGAVILVLWPFIAAISSAVVAMISFVVAGTGALILLAAMGISVGILGVAILALSSWTGAWAGQIKRVEDRFKAVAKVLEKGTGPMLKQMINFLIGLAPIVQMVGLAIESWFGKRLPGILAGINSVIKDLTPSFKLFAQTMSKEFDQAGPVIKQFFEIMAKGGMGALTGLLENLIRLTAWFNKESPKWAPIWDGVGRAVQWVADTWAKLNDWVVANWPATMKQVQQFLDQIKIGWDKWGPALETVIGLVMQFVQVGLQEIINHAEVLVPVILMAIASFFLLVAALAIVVAAVFIAADAITNFLSNTDNQFRKWANSVIGAINAVIDGLNKIPGVHISPVPYLGLGGSTKSGNASNTTSKSGKGRSSGSQMLRHSGGNVSGGEVYIVGGPGAEEIFMPRTSGRIIPATASTGGGADLSQVEKLLGQIEKHLAVLRNEPATINAGSGVRRTA